MGAGVEAPASGSVGAGVGRGVGAAVGPSTAVGAGVSSSEQLEADFEDFPLLQDFEDLVDFVLFEDLFLFRRPSTSVEFPPTSVELDEMDGVLLEEEEDLELLGCMILPLWLEIEYSTSFLSC